MHMAAAQDSSHISIKRRYSVRSLIVNVLVGGQQVRYRKSMQNNHGPLDMKVRCDVWPKSRPGKLNVQLATSSLDGTPSRPF